MEVYDASVTPVPKDRVVMVVDMAEEEPVWEFAAWSEHCWLLSDCTRAAGWCIGDHVSLDEARKFDEVATVASSVMPEPTHWMNVPALPVVAEEEKQLTA